MKYHYKLFAYCIISSLTTAHAFGSEFLTIWQRNREIRQSGLSRCFNRFLREAHQYELLARQTEDPDQQARHLAAAEKARETVNACRDASYSWW